MRSGFGLTGKVGVVRGEWRGGGSARLVIGERNVAMRLIVYLFSTVLLWI